MSEPRDVQTVEQVDLDKAEREIKYCLSTRDNAEWARTGRGWLAPLVAEVRALREERDRLLAWEDRAVRSMDACCAMVGVHPHDAVPGAIKLGSALMTAERDQAKQRAEKAEAAAGEMRQALVRAEHKLAAYVGVCKGDKELTDTVLPMCRAVLHDGLKTGDKPPTFDELLRWHRPTPAEKPIRCDFTLDVDDVTIQCWGYAKHSGDHFDIGGQLTWPASPEKPKPTHDPATCSHTFPDGRLNCGGCGKEKPEPTTSPRTNQFQGKLHAGPVEDCTACRMAHESAYEPAASGQALISDHEFSGYMPGSVEFGKCYRCGQPASAHAPTRASR